MAISQSELNKKSLTKNLNCAICRFKKNVAQNLIRKVIFLRSNFGNIALILTHFSSNICITCKIQVVVVCNFPPKIK